jgi:hypothetical protein
MPVVYLPSVREVQIAVNTEQVTHTVMDARTPGHAQLSVNLAGGFTIQGRESDVVTAAALREAEAAILRAINTP